MTGPSPAALSPRPPRAPGACCCAPPGEAKGIRLFTGGAPNAAGKYYYEQVGHAAPDHGFDGVQPTREGRKEVALLKNGRKAVLRVFDGRQWTFTRLGKEYYKTARKEYVVQLPVTMAYDHGHGRVSESQEYMPSTGTTLGAITLPYAFPNPEQELRRRVADWKRTLDRDAHGRVEVGQDYYLDIYLDEDRPLRFDEEGVRTLDGQPAVQAAIDRPLRGDPYLTVETLMCSPSAFEPNGECMVRLLLGAKRGGRPAFGSREEVQAALDEHADDVDWREGVSTALAERVCRAHGLALEAWWRGARISEVPGRDPLRYVIRGDHAYELAKPPPRALREPRRIPETAIAQDFAHQEQGALPAEAVGPEQVPGGLVAGRAYRATDLDAIRERLHGKWIVPDCRLSGPNAVVALSVPREGGVATVALWKEDAGCEAFCAALAEKLGRPFPYRGETQELLSLRALTELCRGRRVGGGGAAGACALCGDPAQELDHVVRLADGGADDPSNLQPLCAECHRAKSAAERQSSLGDCYLRSRLNRETYAAVPRVQEAPADGADLPGGASTTVCMVDVKRCRFNGLAKLEGTLPIFSPLDAVVPAEAGRLADYNWVAGTVARSDLVALPYWGPGWYGERSCRYLLSHNIIQWGDITHHFTAAAHVPCEYLASRLETLDQCWGEQAKGALNSHARAHGEDGALEVPPGHLHGGARRGHQPPRDAAEGPRVRGAAGLHRQAAEAHLRDLAAHPPAVPRVRAAADGQGLLRHPAPGQAGEHPELPC